MMFHPDHPSMADEVTARAEVVARTIRTHCQIADVNAVSCDEDSWDSTHGLSPSVLAAGWGPVHRDLLGCTFRFQPRRIAKNTLHLPVTSTIDTGSAAHYLELVLMWVTVDANTDGDAWGLFEDVAESLGWTSPGPMQLMFDVHARAIDRILGRRKDLVEDSLWAATDIDLVSKKTS